MPWQTQASQRKADAPPLPPEPLPGVFDSAQLWDLTDQWSLGEARRNIFDHLKRLPQQAWGTL